LGEDDKRLYEAMFLVDSGLAASDWAGVNSAIKNILDRAGADVISLEKWDERRLAYLIQGTARGTYILGYFHASPDKIRSIERDVQLSEQIMRVLILRAEPAMMQAKRRPESGREGSGGEGRPAGSLPGPEAGANVPAEK
jgi:ribosomal protein S6